MNVSECSALQFTKEVMDAARHLNLTTDEDLQRLREDLQLQDEYPGQYVAFVDIWSKSEGQRLLERRVLAHGADYGVASEQLRKMLPVSMPLDNLRTAYIEHPKAGLADRVQAGALDSIASNLRDDFPIAHTITIHR